MMLADNSLNLAKVMSLHVVALAVRGKRRLIFEGFTLGTGLPIGIRPREIRVEKGTNCRLVRITEGVYVNP